MADKLTMKSVFIGERFGRWTVLKPPTEVLCRCDCGNEKLVDAISLRSGRSQSCGCLRAERMTIRFRKHGHCGNNAPTTEYHIWSAMIQRCTNPRNTDFHNYGGRGISVCQEWRDSFELFLNDVGRRPRNLTLDRIDNNGNYEPGNVRWATKSQQTRNSRRWQR